MKETKLKVTFSLSDAQTKGGCKYDVASMKDALERYKEKLGDGCTALGELADAPSTNPIYGSNLLYENLAVSTANASHIVESVSMDDDGNLTGTIRLLDTINGKLASDMVAKGFKLCMIPRALGIREGDTYKVDTIVSFDIMIMPETPHQSKRNEPHPLGTCSECAFGHWFGDGLFCDFGYAKGDTAQAHGANPNGRCGMFQGIDDNFEEDKIVITLPATDTYGKYHIDPLKPEGRGLAYLKEDLSYILGCGRNDIKVEFKSKRDRH
jgi:hypothetical protein